MFKRIIVILAIFLLLAPASAAYADAVVEPDNNFYNKHQSQTVYLGRSFVANGEDGSVSVKDEPGAKKDLRSIKNGADTYIDCSCLYDGDFWGYTYEYAGWVRLDQMLVLYDYVAFAEDHQNEFYTYDGDYAEIKEAGSAVMWPWPGAEESIWTLEDIDTEYFNVWEAYKDAEGREWGFVTYLWGDRNIWVCLSDPTNENLPALNPAPEPGVWVSGTEHVDIKQDLSGKRFPILFIIIILVAVVVVVTVIVIKVFWKPNKTNREGGNNV